MRLLAVSFGLLIIAAPSACAADLDRELLRAAPEVIRILERQGVKNVGVVKFSVAEGDAKPTDVGELNQTIADRLELALILKTDVYNPLGVIRNATAMASVIPGADHTTKAGRGKLFAAKYPLAWGNTDVPADALLTGVVRIGAGRQMSVRLVAYLASNLEANPITVAEFEAGPSVATLLEAGGSFTTRGQFTDGKLEIDQEKLKEKQTAAVAMAVEAAEAVRKEPKGHPANPDTSPPLGVRILYDGVEQKVEFRDGDAWIPEPEVGQKVSFVMERLNAGRPGAVGVVLKINGENSIEKQRVRDTECKMWVLRQGAKYTIAGFLLPNKQEGNPFKVITPAESKANEFRYGSEVGTISWTVFQSVQPTDAPAVRVVPEERAAGVLHRGLFPEEKADSIEHLREKLLKPASANRRGLISDNPNDVIRMPTKPVAFEPDPVPVLRATVRYYRRTK